MASDESIKDRLARLRKAKKSSDPLRATPKDESTRENLDRVPQKDAGTHAGMTDLAAAQIASLPLPSKLERAEASEPTRGASLRVELANIPLFGDLDPVTLHRLISRVRVVRLNAGQTLFREGDEANSLYIITKGAVVPIAEGRRRHKLAVLEQGDFFGETGLLTQQPRNATVEGLVDTELLAIDRRILSDLIEQQPSIAKNVLRFLRVRLVDRQIRTQRFFAAFAYADRKAIAAQFRILEVANGTRIVEQGVPPDGLFIVLSGRLQRFERATGMALGELGVGDLFGGLSLLEGQPSTADVIAAGKCWLVVLGETRFRRLMDANPRLVRVLRQLESADAQMDEVLPVAAL